MLNNKQWQREHAWGPKSRQEYDSWRWESNNTNQENWQVEKEAEALTMKKKYEKEVGSDGGKGEGKGKFDGGKGNGEGKFERRKKGPYSDNATSAYWCRTRRFDSRKAKQDAYLSLSTEEQLAYNERNKAKPDEQKQGYRT
jgi:hypothetical protein